MARITFSFPDQLAPSIDDRVRDSGFKSTSDYICKLVEADLESVGMRPGDPLHEVRLAALSAAELTSPDEVLSALKPLREGFYSGHAKNAECVEVQPV